MPSCLCGKCVVEKPQANPLFSVYCHCTICQKYHGTNYVHLIGYSTNHVELGDLKKNVRGYRSSEYVTRYNCVDCGCPVYSECTFPEFSFVDFNSIMVPGITPTCHIYYNSRVKDVKDLLLKYSERFGGDVIPHEN